MKEEADRIRQENQALMKKEMEEAYKKYSGSTTVGEEAEDKTQKPTTGR